MAIFEDYVLSSKPWPTVLTCVVVLIVSFWLIKSPRATKNGKVPSSIPDWLPGVGNAYRYVFHNMEFLKRAKGMMNGRNIMKFRLGPKGVYLITGAKNVQSVLRNSGHLSSNKLVLMALEQLDGATKEDLEKFKADTSGRSHVPLTKIPEEERIWAPNHRIFLDHVSNSQAVGTMTDKFCDLFSQTLSQRSSEEWQTLRLYDFLSQEMARCAIISLSGSEILKLNPGFIEAMWDLDSCVYPLALGVPRFLYAKAYNLRDKFHEMGDKYLTAAWKSFDWNSPNAMADWEPTFGTRFSRTHSKFLKDKGFALRSRTGMHLGSTWALNANTIPVTGWAMIEIIKDKALLQAIRAEVSTAFNNSKIDIKKLIELPLLQSVYTESLRMHVSINITREIEEDMALDGYALNKGYLVQTPSLLSHYDENIWSVPGHPASEFWAERHIIHVETPDGTKTKTTTPQFSMAGRSGGFFPFGGGISICPGRHFAKQEIMAAIAMMVMNFDIEFEQYVMMDGSKSDRGPKDNPWYCGTAAMPPDRDMEIKWKRL